MSSQIPDAPVRSGQAPRSKRLLIVAGVALIAAGAGWYVLHGKNDAAAKDAARRGGQPQAVGVATVVQKDVKVMLSALGTVTSNQTVTVHSRVDGQLDKLHFQEGQPVTQGQLLAEIDPRPFQAQLAQAEGQLQRDEALLSNAKIDLERYRQLLEQNSIAKQQADTQAALVRQYQGTVRVDQGAVDNARLQLAYSRITAPISGRAGLRQIDPGNIVHASDANGLVVITQTQPINVIFPLPETSLSSVLKPYLAGEKLRVEAWDRDNRTRLAEGMLQTIDNQLNTGTGTVNLKARFANGDDALYPNQFVNVRIQLSTRQGATVAPTVAIQHGRGGSYVYVAKPDQTVAMRKVETGPTEEDLVIVESGLKPGERVVVDGVDKLRDGAKIRVIDRAGQARADAQGARGHGRKPASAAH